jgi:hypothetical protein
MEDSVIRPHLVLWIARNVPNLSALFVEKLLTLDFLVTNTNSYILLQRFFKRNNGKPNKPRNVPNAHFRLRKVEVVTISSVETALMNSVGNA